MLKKHRTIYKNIFFVGIICLFASFYTISNNCFNNELKNISTSSPKDNKTSKDIFDSGTGIVQSSEDKGKLSKESSSGFNKTTKVTLSKNETSQLKLIEKKHFQVFVIINKPPIVMSDLSNTIRAGPKKFNNEPLSLV